MTKQTLILPVLLLSIFCSSQTRTVSATIDASKTGAPISKYIYGQFLEHIAGIVNNNIWAEMLDDRKFYYPINSHPPAEPEGPRFRRVALRTIPLEVSGDSPQPKPIYPAGGDQPAVNPGSDTFPLDVSAALSDDRKTLTFAVLNPSDSEQDLKLAINSAELSSQGRLWRMAPASVDATITVGQKPGVKVEEQTLTSVSKNMPVPPFSVNIYSFSVR